MQVRNIYVVILNTVKDDQLKQWLFHSLFISSLEEKGVNSIIQVLHK